MVDSDSFQKEKDIQQDRVFKQLLNTFYHSSNQIDIKQEKNTNQINKNSIKIEPKLIYNSFHKILKVEFRIGDKQLYKLKNLPEFYERMLKHENYRYGTKLEFVHNEEAFEENSIPMLHYLLKYAEIIKYANESASSYGNYVRTMGDEFITVSNSGMDELFEILKDKYVIIQDEVGYEKKIYFKDEEPDIKFYIEPIDNGNYQMNINIDAYLFEMIEGKDYLYFLYKNTLYKCNKEFENTTLKLIEVYRNNYTKKIKIKKEDLSKLFSIVFPKVKKNISLEKMPQNEIEHYVPKDLFVKLYLDFNELNYIVAEVEFVYGDTKFNPFLQEKLEMVRDIAKENEVLDKFVKTGFMLDKENARLILASEEKIYNFLVYDIEEYMHDFEVLATNNFKQREVRSPKINSLKIKIENNLLDIDFSGLDFDLEELRDIMKKYRLKKKYYKLKDGSFLKLENNEAMQFIDSITSGVDIDYQQVKNGDLQLPLYRSMYLDRLLKKIDNANIVKSAEYKELVKNIDAKEIDEDIMLPKQINADLRSYQKARI